MTTEIQLKKILIHLLCRKIEKTTDKENLVDQKRVKNCRKIY